MCAVLDTEVHWPLACVLRWQTPQEWCGQPQRLTAVMSARLTPRQSGWYELGHSSQHTRSPPSQHTCSERTAVAEEMQG